MKEEIKNEFVPSDRIITKEGCTKRRLSFTEKMYEIGQILRDKLNVQSVD